MRYIRLFESFDSENILDYIYTEVPESESDINFKDINNYLIFISYLMPVSLVRKLKTYLESSVRFKNFEILTQYFEDEGRFDVLIVDKNFYDRNKKWLYNNIEWEEHPTTRELKRTSFDKFDPLLDRFKNAQIAKNLPKSVSMIRNLDRQGEVEIWDRENMDDPEKIAESDSVYIQYKLFKLLT